LPIGRRPNTDIAQQRIDLGTAVFIQIVAQSAPHPIAMINPSSYPATQGTADHFQPARAAFLGLATFALLWILYIPYRELYVPNGVDIPALADGLLLAPDAHWQTWFTCGYSQFWDLYPDWEGPSGVTAFARPAFQFMIYLAHFAFGKDWASYNVISCFAAAGVAALAFQIAQMVLELRTGLSLLAAMLVVLSPPILQNWLGGLAFAIESLGTVLVVGAFFAAFTRHDFLCLTILFLALLTKENTVWAPAAAAITIMWRPKLDESLRRRAFTAAAMFAPVVMWLGLRFVFFGGIGGTYATEGYTPLAGFLHLTLLKLTHLHHLFITHYDFVTEGRWVLLNRGIAIGTAVLLYALLSAWALHMLTEAGNRLRHTMQEKRWPTADAAFLVSMWAAIALAFHFALPTSAGRYATSVVVFAWPALVAEVQRRRNAVISLGFAVCCVLSPALSWYLSVTWRGTSIVQYNHYRLMGAVLRQAPTATQQLYVLSAGSLQLTNPKYLRLVLGVTAEILRVAEIDWNCGESNDVAAFDHSTVDGVVNMTVTLPACATFSIPARLDGSELASRHLYRGDKMSYDVPEANPINSTKWWWDLGRTMIVHVRPNGPARFIIEHGRPDGIAWFDTP
jgi:hypothetical protein